MSNHCDISVLKRLECRVRALGNTHLMFGKRSGSVRGWSTGSDASLSKSSLANSLALLSRPCRNMTVCVCAAVGSTVYAVSLAILDFVNLFEVNLWQVLFRSYWRRGCCGVSGNWFMNETLLTFIYIPLSPILERQHRQSKFVAKTK